MPSSSRESNPELQPVEKINPYNAGSQPVTASQTQAASPPMTAEFMLELDPPRGSRRLLLTPKDSSVGRQYNASMSPRRTPFSSSTMLMPASCQPAPFSMRPSFEPSWRSPMISGPAQRAALPKTLDDPEQSNPNRGRRAERCASARWVASQGLAALRGPPLASPGILEIARPRAASISASPHFVSKSARYVERD